MSTAPDSPSSALPFAGAMAGWGDLFKAFVPSSGTAANPAVPLPGAQATLPPGLSHWLTPSASPDELNKRIEDLKTVKFWLDQNAALVDSTIRTLEVQRLTLATLHTLNVPLQSMMEAMAAPWSQMAASAAPAADAPAPAVPAAPAAAPAPQAAEASSPAAEPAAPESVAADSAAALPTQWWNDMTGQFARLAQAVVDQGQVLAETVAGAGEAVARSGAASPAKPRRAKAAAPKAAAAKPAKAKAPAKTSTRAAVPAATRSRKTSR